MLLDTGSLVVDKINRLRLKLRTRCNNTTVCSEISFLNAHLSSLNKFLNTVIWALVQHTAQKNLGLVLWINILSQSTNLPSFTPAEDLVYRRCITLHLRLTDCPDALLPFHNHSGKCLKYSKSREPTHIFTGERNPHILLTCRYFATCIWNAFFLKILSNDNNNV